MARPESLPEIVGQVLSEAREQAGLTQEELAAKARMDRSYISDIERGTASLSLDRLFRLCDALSQSAAEIVARINRRRSK